MGIRCADHVTTLYPQKLALTSPTGGGRSVGIVRSRTKATEFSLVGYIHCCTKMMHSHTNIKLRKIPHKFENQLFLTGIFFSKVTECFVSLAHISYSVSTEHSEVGG